MNDRSEGVLHSESLTMSTFRVLQEILDQLDQEAAQARPLPQGRTAVAPYAPLGAGAVQDGTSSDEIPEIPVQARRSTELHPELYRRMQAIAAETASLRPQLIDPNGSPNDPRNWESGSLQRLQDARAAIGAMNGTVNPRMAYGNLPPEWSAQSNLIRSAAEASMSRQLDPRATNMSMHQQGLGRQSESGWLDRGGSILESYGPFVQTWNPPQIAIDRGRAIPAGPGAFIDIYARPNEKRIQRWSGR